MRDPIIASIVTTGWIITIIFHVSSLVIAVVPATFDVPMLIVIVLWIAVVVGRWLACYLLMGVTSWRDVTAVGIRLVRCVGVESSFGEAVVSRYCFLNSNNAISISFVHDIVVVLTTMVKSLVIFATGIAVSIRNICIVLLLPAVSVSISITTIVTVHSAVVT